MSETPPSSTRQIERLSHVQQRIANAAALSQARGITTWLIVGVIGALIQTYIRPELGDSPRIWLRHGEDGLAFTSFIFVGLCLFGILNELLRRRKSLEMILPPNKLTLHFSINALSAIMATLQIIFTCMAWVLGTELPKGWLIGAMLVSAFMIYSHFRSNRTKDSEEVFPGLHPFSLKYIYRRIGILRKWPVIAFLLVFTCIMLLPIVMVDLYWFWSVDTSVVRLLRSPLTSYFIGVIGLITYILIRESSFREIRSLRSLERIIANQPTISDVQFGFMLRATYTSVSSLVYTQVLDGYLVRSFQFIEAEYRHVRELLPRVIAEAPASELKSRLQDLAGEFNLQVFLYIEISKPLTLWIQKYLGSEAEETWARLLNNENERVSRIERMNKSLFDQ